MNSREKILTAVKNSQPAFVELPIVDRGSGEARANEFATILGSIGGAAHFVTGVDEITAILKEKFPGAKRILSDCMGLSDISIGNQDIGDGAQALADTDLAILRAHFAVAENGAVWLTEDSMIDRALPFICQHLAVIIDKKDIVATLHEAYARIAGDGYGFGVFISGPSKTADIEQSLVLGAHGPVSMTVFIMD